MENAVEEVGHGWVIGPISSKYCLSEERDHVSDHLGYGLNLREFPVFGGQEAEKSSVYG